MQQQQTVLHVFNVHMVTYLMPQECRFVICVHLDITQTNSAKQHAEPVIQGHIAASLQPARVLPVQMARLQTWVQHPHVQYVVLDRIPPHKTIQHVYYAQLEHMPMPVAPVYACNATQGFIPIQMACLYVQYVQLDSTATPQPPYVAQRQVSCAQQDQHLSSHAHQGPTRL